MISLRLQVNAALFGIATVISSVSIAQETYSPTVQAVPSDTAAESALSQEQLDQLVAPIALYPDPLLLNILTASTYPLDIVEAKRWLADPVNSDLQGDALAKALANQDWAPSVKALVPFPQVLQMMDANLDWTERLGEAFLAQQADVMDAVQALRQRAESAGTLGSYPEQSVMNEGSVVTISPPPGEPIYVPVYNPWCVYGSWPYPAYPPFYFSSWPGYCGSADYGIGFGVGIVLPFWFWEWGHFDWHHHDIRIDGDRYDQFHPRHAPGGTWHFDPTQRNEVPFRDQRNVQHFQPQQNNQRTFRGFTGNEFRPAEPVHPAPREEVPTQGQRNVRQPQQSNPPAFQGGPALREAVPAQGRQNVRPVPLRQNERPALEGSQEESARPAPPAFSNYGHGPEIRTQSKFGQSSLQGGPKGPSRSSGEDRGGQRGDPSRGERH